jgi:hypothetical protein
MLCSEAGVMFAPLTCTVLLGCPVILFVFFLSQLILKNSDFKAFRLWKKAQILKKNRFDFFSFEKVRI